MLPAVESAIPDRLDESSAASPACDVYLLDDLNDLNAAAPFDALLPGREDAMLSRLSMAADRVIDDVRWFRGIRVLGIRTARTDRVFGCWDLG